MFYYITFFSLGGGGGQTLELIIFSFVFLTVPLSHSDSPRLHNFVEACGSLSLNDSNTDFRKWKTLKKFLLHCLFSQKKRLERFFLFRSRIWAHPKVLPRLMPVLIVSAVPESGRLSVTKLIWNGRVQSKVTQSRDIIEIIIRMI